MLHSLRIPLGRVARLTTCVDRGYAGAYYLVNRVVGGTSSAPGKAMTYFDKRESEGFPR